MVIVITKQSEWLIEMLLVSPYSCGWGGIIVHQTGIIGFNDACAGSILLQLSKSAGSIIRGHADRRQKEEAVQVDPMETLVKSECTGVWDSK